MRNVTKEMIKIYEINKLGYDFMGYIFQRNKELSFHHLVVPKRQCKEFGLGEGYLFWNGAVLKQSTSHAYLHIIERIDRDAFIDITDAMIDENKRKKLEIRNLKRIRDILLSFEREHDHDKDRDGNYIIKRSFVNERIKF